MQDRKYISTEPMLGGIKIIFNRSQERNSLNAQLLNDLYETLTECESNPEINIIQIEGKDGFFCTGMDFKEIASKDTIETSLSDDNGLYMRILNHMATSEKIFISKIDGKVLAGGIGIVAASDFVFSTLRSTYCLSEALWGLLPCCVAPYLIRRVGFQNAYRLTLTTETINAEKAKEINLVDELFDNDDEKIIRQLFVKLSRLDPSTIKNLKSYFRKMWIVTSEMEETAQEEINRLIGLPEVQTKIKNFVNHQRFPWEK